MVTNKRLIKSIAESKLHNEAINTVIANQQTLADDAQALTTKQSRVESCWVKPAAEKVTLAEDEKASLLDQKAAAEAAAKKQQQKQKQLIKPTSKFDNKRLADSGNTTFTAMFKQYLVRLNSSQAVLQQNQQAIPAPVTHRPTYSTNASSYPTGECT